MEWAESSGLEKVVHRCTVHSELGKSSAELCAVGQKSEGGEKSRPTEGGISICGCLPSSEGALNRDIKYQLMLSYFSDTGS
jgi:hypothetical protein